MCGDYIIPHITKKINIFLSPVEIILHKYYKLSKYIEKRKVLVYNTLWKKVKSLNGDNTGGCAISYLTDFGAEVLISD